MEYIAPHEPVNPTTPYSRTTCSCATCIQCCKEQPGPLVPGDFERIRDHLGLTDTEARAYFWSSPGSLVMDTSTGRQSWIRSITPKYVRGRCVFLDAEDRCRVHAVAPAGCAIFDTHQTREVAHTRMLWCVKEQLQPGYQELRKSLDVATHSKPRGY